ncbi:hypothetical protein [Mycobacterium sp. MUNTM1]
MSDDVLICSVTGLALVPAAGQTVFRLAKPSYGPLNPQCRTISSCDDRSSWNRFDLPGEQTIYAASNPEGAYGELLGRLKKPRPVPAARYLDDVGSATMEELIAEDWAAAGKKLAPYVVDINWLYEFRLYTLTLPEHGWLVESEHSRTVNFLQSNIPGNLWERGIQHVTVSTLRCEDRYVTTYLAERLARARVVGDITPLGLRYGSKHGSDWDCWTVWLREGVADSMGVDGGTAVAAPNQNPVLAKVLDTFGLSAG